MPKTRSLLDRLLRAEGHSSDRTSELTTLVCQLMAEVEALRLTLAEVAPKAYRAAYVKAHILANNSAGPSSGQGKLVARMLGDSLSSESDPYAPPQKQMEFLRELGASEAEITAFGKKILEVREYT